LPYFFWLLNVSCCAQHHEVKQPSIAVAGVCWLLGYIEKTTLANGAMVLASWTHLQSPTCSILIATASLATLLATATAHVLLDLIKEVAYCLDAH
jgi:hypothetical protein